MSLVLTKFVVFQVMTACADLLLLFRRLGSRYNFLRKNARM
jgi:hypothetical protein